MKKEGAKPFPMMFWDISVKQSDDYDDTYEDNDEDLDELTEE